MRATSDIVYKDKKCRTERCARRIDLRIDTVYSFPLKTIALYTVICFGFFSFVFGSVYAPISGGYLFAASSTKEEERAQLEAQLKELEKQIAQYEGTVAEYKKQGSTLQAEVTRMNNKIAQLNLQIKSVTLNLQKLDKDIAQTKVQIIKTEGDIDKQKRYLIATIQQLDESDKKGMVELLASHRQLSDFFSDVTGLMLMQQAVKDTLVKIVNLKTDLVEKKEALALQYDDVSQLKKYQEDQKKLTQKTQDEKKTLLQITKGQESKYQQILAETKKTASEIRSRLFEFVGGGELTFGNAYKLAKIASDATGVRTALILAVLDRESALGRNVGKCTYDKNPYYPNRATNVTTMHPTRDIPPFLDILKELKMDPATAVVSCPIPQDGAYGGGMGPAQFIPSTWVRFKDRIAQATGHNPPSPWNNTDAFMATGLYLKDVGAAGGSLYDEKVAAARYYAGGRYKSFISSYGERVVQRAQSFQADIDVLNGKTS